MSQKARHRASRSELSILRSEELRYFGEKETIACTTAKGDASKCLKLQMAAYSHANYQ